MGPLALGQHRAVGAVVSRSGVAGLLRVSRPSVAEWPAHD